MSYETLTAVPVAPPRTERPRRYRPKLRYELIGCGLHGHELLGTDGELAAVDEPDLFEHYGLAYQSGASGERRLARH